MIQRGTQATGLGVLKGRFSLDCPHWRPDRHPANVRCSFFRYTNDDLKNHSNQRCKQKIWTREDNHLALDSYFRINPTQRVYRKRMIEIWQECASFQTTSRRHADQVRTIIKKGWFSDLDILEIQQKMNNEQETNTISNTPSINKQEKSKRNEPPTSPRNQTTQSKH